jgi:hypothetical protein
MTEPNIEELEAKLKEFSKSPAAIANMDQNSAALDEMLNAGTWWALLCLFSIRNDSHLAYTAALRNFNVRLEQIDHINKILLISFLFHELVSRTLHEDYGNDVEAAVLEMGGEELLAHFRTYVATGGQTCPSCGEVDCEDRMGSGDDEPGES